MKMYMNYPFINFMARLFATLAFILLILVAIVFALGATLAILYGVQSHYTILSGYAILIGLAGFVVLTVSSEVIQLLLSIEANLRKMADR